MPALTPKGSVLFEEGGYYIDGENQDKFIEVSPDGYIKMPPTANLDGIVLELKCPYPNDMMLNVHYAIPVHYTIQLLCHMVVKEVKHAWYCSYSKQSMVVLELKFHESVWLDVIKLLKELYDREEIPVPRKKVQHQQSMKQLLQDYVNSNMCIIGEVPSVQQSQLEGKDLLKGNEPHTLQCVPRRKLALSKSSIATQLCSVCRTSKDLIEEVYDLQQRKATELLAFVVSDTDRIHNAEKPNQIPIAYALKGHSLTCDVLRQMIDQVHDRCMEHGIRIVANAMDGQWSKLTTRSSEGEPLTRLQYQKDIWNLYHKDNKATLLQKLNEYSTVTESVLKDVFMLHLDIGGTFISGNIHISVKCINGQRKSIHVSSIGDEEYRIPMIQHITSTKVASAWKRKIKAKKQVMDDCKDIIDELSLIRRNCCSRR